MESPSNRQASVFPGVSRRQHVRGMALTTGGVLVLSPDSLLVRLIETGALTVNFWRGALLALALGSFLIIRHGRATPKQWRAMGLPGLFSALLLGASMVFFVSSITLTAVANTLVILSASPLFAAMFSAYFLRESIAPRTWLSTIIVLAGIGIIFAGSLGGGTVIGDLCALGAACCMAANLVVVRYARAVDMLPAVALSGLFIALAFAPFSTPLALSSRDCLLLAVLGLLVLPISLAFITRGPRYLSAPEVSLIMLLETIFGPFWVWLVVGEVPAVATLIGGVLVLGTIVSHTLLELKQPPSV